jgi:aspartate aminotransferase-like enzyme
VAEKHYLLTPGPTPIPPEVAAAMSAPMIHHRGAAFRTLFTRCLARLHEVFRTQNDVLVFTSSGSGAMESAISNLGARGQRVVVVSAGHFGERWAAIAGAYGCEVEHLRYAWGETPPPDDLAARLRELGGESIVLLTQSETSTGVVADVQSLAGACRETGSVAVVDAISSLGAVPLDVDEWGVDVAVSGSQKALMTPPGLAFVSASQAAWRRREQGDLPRFYFDWERTRKAQERPLAAFTPAVSLLAGLDVALGLLLDKGLPAAFEHHARLGRACREGAKAMGLELFSPDDERSAVVTAIKAPDGIDSDEVVAELRERFGITIAGGQGELRGLIFRIGHIGFMDVFDVSAALAGLELALADAGADVERGVAASRALETYAAGARV